MFCPSCGNAVESGHRFCHQCGASLAAVQPTVPTLRPVVAVSSPAPPPPPLTVPVPTGPTPPPPPQLESVEPAPRAPLAPIIPTLSLDPLPTIEPLPPLKPLAPLVPIATSAPVPTTEQVPTTQPVPVVEPLAPMPAVGVVPVTDEVPIVEQTQPAAVPSPWAAEAATQPVTVVEARSGVTEELPVVGRSHAVAVAQLVLAAVAAVIAVATAFVDFVSVEVTGTDRLSAVFRLDDLASGNVISLAIGAALLLVGAVLGVTGVRFGAGLSGGAALALAGMLATSVGLGVTLLDSIEAAYLPTPGNTVTVTRELGFFLAIAAAALAAISFALSLGAARGRRRSPLVVMVLGVLAVLAAVVGVLLPGGDAVWLDNVSQDWLPDATMYIRLGVLVLFLVGGVVGFAVSGRFGGAMVLGAVSIAAQQTVMAYLEVGDAPLGFAIGNPNGGDGGFQFSPHPVTMAALGAVLLLGVLCTVLPLRDRS